ncbi:MAG: hypothetical protein KJN81_05445, partial [Acidimicrobiia bacterium]|nr:hypothetical protein [Acidimicrobiia bacterium]
TDSSASRLEGGTRRMARSMSLSTPAWAKLVKGVIHPIVVPPPGSLLQLLHRGPAASRPKRTRTL